VWLGLVRLRYTEQAAELTRRISELIVREGLREYYNPRSGVGMGARGFAWSSLALDMAEGDPRAGSSYLKLR
jgi:hypothetical protein